MNQKKLKSTLVEVRAEDFDVQTLRQAALEGRLYVAQPALTEEEAETQRRLGCAQIMEYVKRIDCYATLPAVDELWSEIVDDELLQPTLFMWRYSRCRGQVNWYRVTAIVCLLYELGVYSQELTAVRLHCLLEGTERRTSRYTGMSRYLLEQHEQHRIKDMIKMLRQ